MVVALMMAAAGTCKMFKSTSAGYTNGLKFLC
jgi:hypothetical protein